MAKAPSDATRLRTTQRELRDNYTLLTNARNERDHYRARATKAEQEVAANRDAERYRWLRENCRDAWEDHSDPVQLIHYEPHTDIHGWEERLDAAIDAAMNKD